jgi:hypothetical protein
MSDSRFISARIPSELLEKIEEYTQVTGESKTDTVIQALNAYLDSWAAKKETKNEYVRAEALKGLAAYLPDDLLPIALEIASNFRDEFARAKALKALASRLPKNLLPKALQVARDIEDDLARAKALTGLATYQSNQIPEVLHEAFNTVNGIKSDSARTEVLSELVAQLPQEIQSKKEEILRKAFEVDHRNE